MKKEPKWLQDAASSMLRGPKESYGDEDQNDLMEMIDDGDHEDTEEPAWLTKLAKGCLTDPKEPYGDDDQNDLMDLIDK